MASEATCDMLYVGEAVLCWHKCSVCPYIHKVCKNGGTVIDIGGGNMFSAFFYGEGRGRSIA